MNNKHTQKNKVDKDIRNESAELNGIKVDHKDFEPPRSTFEMLEQTCQIA